MKCRHCRGPLSEAAYGSFCSLRCNRDWMSEEGKRRRPRPSPTATVVEKVCEGCGDSFEVTKYASRRRFCSGRCHERHRDTTVKGKARLAVQYAVKVGKIERPDRCEDCGRDRPLQGHHEDYDRPLDVVWLCRPCHVDRHREERAA